MTLFTIGYEGQTPQEFLTWLNYHHVSFVVDVRELPLSRKKGFSKTALSTMLLGNHIEYMNLRGLGTTKEMRTQLKSTGNFKIFSKNYAQTLSERGNDIKTIMDLINSGETVALLCFERDPETCHRSLVANEIKKQDGNGLKIKHIVPAL
ncbi:protein of unknown function DUF1130 [Desulfatibacillum aliphaticivorans]|uniref:DUF488 domain-containing protein n=1 Tax=Desulfatibacillum aliphaticivorans TaxID=218208 RepID=B8FFE8_DESAL|nr:DUF488 domain-containing protein [Desulfatibacillum aliphaticivorans]ACL04208.1 protein of unknown function DUF1130 [Desulfatibacillum aliphaticivorans]